MHESILIKKNVHSPILASVATDAFLREKTVTKAKISTYYTIEAY